MTQDVRPQLARQDTIDLMSYYHSPEADKGPGFKRTVSTGSSSSEYSTDSSLSEYSFKADSPPPPSAALHRKRQSSEGASDRRRLAVVQMDTFSDVDSTQTTAPSSADSLRSRRGKGITLDGLALVAPPDASPKSYRSTSPPPTAPLSSVPKQYESQSDSRSQGHYRSASEATGKKPPSRTIAIIGTTRTPLITETQAAAHDTSTLRPPLFVAPQLHSPSSPMPGSAAPSPIITPVIGQEKRIGDPVAGPVVMTLSPNQIADALRPSSTPTPSTDELPSGQSKRTSPDPNSYLNYQPGIHATAGPLPPPPRATFALGRDSPPPPRPPRFHTPSPVGIEEREAVKKALQLPPSVSAAFAFKTKPTVQSNDPITRDAKSDATNHDESGQRSSHRREGAFSPTVVEPMAASPNPPSEASPLIPMPEKTAALSSVDDNQSITVLAPPTSEEQNTLPSDMDLPASSLEGRRSADISVSSHSSHGQAPSPPPKSPKNLRNSLTRGLKRMSLSRSPSFKSLSASSNSGHATSVSPPLPSSHPPSSFRPIPARNKIRTLYPAAMYCHEVQSQRTAQERCAIYAQKINELYICDCGLADWVLEATIRRANGSQSNLKVNVIPSVPSVQQFTPQPRQTSRGSQLSEATFPVRPDATVATDLTRTVDGLPQTGMPPLPYPALAQTIKSSANKPLQTNNLTVPVIRTSSISPSKATGFFSSLGRKASLSRKPQQPGPPTMPTSRLTKPPPRPSNTQSVPGGPRAPGHRMGRAQSIMISSPFSSSSSSSDKHASSIARRPSLHTPPEHVLDIQADPEFNRQVNHLSTIIPHADRDILAGYLRRAGSDILAIGQYLEDEKNNTLKRL